MPVASNKQSEAEKLQRIQKAIDGERSKLGLKDVVLSSEYFAGIQLPPRQYFLRPWLPEGAFGFINGWRGAGKTWLALGIADAVTAGHSFGPWENELSAPVLFLDGEMAMIEKMERLVDARLDTPRKYPLFILSDALLNRLGLPKCHLADRKFQKEMKAVLLDLGVKLFIVDNIASLTPGLVENSKEEWDPINQFFIALRFAGITTIAVHHLGKGGDQRGTSSREDNADFSIKLTRPAGYAPEDGCRFVATFSKARVHTRDLHKIADTEFRLQLDDEGHQVWTFNSVKQNTKIEVLRGITGGLTQKEITETLGLTKGTVSKAVKKAIDDGLVHKNRDGNYVLTQSGEVLLCGI